MTKTINLPGDLGAVPPLAPSGQDEKMPTAGTGRTSEKIDVRSFKLGESAGQTTERELCKRDVCMYCGGRAFGYNRKPEGPNDAGNWVHESQTDRRENDTVLCLASSICARETFERMSELRKDGAK